MVGKQVKQYRGGIKNPHGRKLVQSGTRREVFSKTKCVKKHPAAHRDVHKSQGDDGARLGAARRALRLLTALPLLLSSVACSAETQEHSQPPSAFHVVLPSSPPLTVSDIESLKKELMKADGNPPAQKLRAAAFDDYSARPRRTDSEWIAFINTYARVRDLALSQGWNVLVEGFTQATDPVGTTDPLSLRRAERARGALIDLGYPPVRVSAVGRGVGGPDPDDRRVLITFVRTDP